MECTWFADPIHSSDVTAFRASAGREDDTKDDEANNSNDFDDCKDEFRFTISSDTEEVDTNNE